jgi:hypothetical protein
MYCDGKNMLLYSTIIKRYGSQSEIIIADSSDHKLIIIIILLLLLYIYAYLCGSWVSVNHGSVKLTSQLHPRLRVSGAITLLPMYAFMAWTGTTLPYYRKN